MRIRFTRSRLVAIIIATLGLVTTGIAFAAFPDTNVTTYTGCLNTGGSSGGQLGQVAVGLSPLKTCGANQALVHLSGGDITKVSAGSGLTAAPSAGDNGAVTLSLAGGYSLPQSCANGQAPVESGGSWNCGNFANADQSCPSGQFVSGIGADGSLTCATPELSKVATAALTGDEWNDSDPHQIVHLKVKNDGVYLVIAKSSLEAVDDQSVICWLDKGDGLGPIDQTDVDLEGPATTGTNADKQTMVLTARTSLTTATDLSVYCQGSGHMFAIHTVLTAMQVSGSPG